MRIFLTIIILILTFFGLVSCKRANEDSTRVLFQLPQPQFVSAPKNASMSVSASSWNSSLVPANISEINCYVIMVALPEAGPGSHCYDTANAPLFSYHHVTGGVGASGQQITIELPSGAGRRFYILGMKADTTNLATACQNFKSAGIDKSVLSQPLLIGQKIADLAPGEVKVDVGISLTSSVSVSSCEGLADITPITPTPTFTITSSDNVSSATTPTFSGVCTDGLPISITGAETGSTTCSSGTWTYTVASLADGTHNYSFSQTNSAGVTTSDTSTWIKDTVGPTLTSFSLVQASPVSNPNISFNFQGSDSGSVSKYCVKNSSAVPTLTDLCWKAVPTPGPTQTVSGEPYFLSLIPGSYNLYLFLQDSAGNISALTSSGAGTAGTDKFTVTYTPNSVPIVSNLIISNIDAMSGALSELSGTSGAPFYVRWTATGTIDASGISLFYSTDDKNWTVLASNLTNGANSCTVNGPGVSDNAATGCYTGTIPTSNFFRVKIEVSNGGFKTGMYSVSFNASDFREVAGRPGSGIGFDASLLKVGTVPFGGFQSDNSGLAVDSSGVVYVRDTTLGIIKIDPVTRTSSVYIPKTGTSTGDGGTATSATLKLPYKIAVDGDDNLYIFDEARIRKVAKSTGVIQTLIGGGGETARTTKLATALQLQFTTSHAIDSSFIQAMPFVVLKNGDILFEDKYRTGSETTAENYFWYYDHANGNVFPQVLSGTGYSANASENIALCNATRIAVEYSPSTNIISHYLGVLSASNTACLSGTEAARLTTAFVSTTPVPPALPGGNSSYVNLITGLDGKIYGHNSINGKIYTFNSTTNTWTSIAGTGTLGICADGINATTCAMTPTNVTVSKTGQIYFVEAGKIRTIHTDGSIRTVYGISSSAGDSGPGLLAQFGTLLDIGYWFDGTNRKVIGYDKSNKNLREIDLVNDSVSTIAGNGTVSSPISGDLAASTGLGNINWEKTFAVNPANGDAYWKGTSGGGQLLRLTRTTGNWENVVGGGANGYFSAADGMVGLDVNFASGYIQPVLFAGGSLFAHASTASHTDVAVKSYSAGSFTQTNYLSLSGAYSSSCTAPTACGTYFPANGTLRVSFNTQTSKMLFAMSGTSAIKYSDAGSIYTLTSTANAIGSFVYRYQSPDNIIYYCGSSTGGLYKRNATTNTETAISLPTNVKCNSSKLEVDTTGNQLLFIYEKLGNYGIGAVPL